MRKKMRKASRTSDTEISGAHRGRPLVRAQPSMMAYRPWVMFYMPHSHPSALRSARRMPVSENASYDDLNFV